jgi:REP-associated tyrosine transposase
MPRGPRLDAPGVLHHVMARGIDRQAIFRDDQDREDLLRRLSDLVRDHQLKIFAWALMSDHFHLLVQTGQRPLEFSMRSLLTGFATVFNRRYGRVGHLFQNRYKSVVCEVERYFLELVRYIHLNPLRGGIVPDFDALDEYPYTGHSALLGATPRGWQSTEPVLERFGRRLSWARATYRKFVSEGVLLGRRPELIGGGLIRSSGGWDAVKKLRRGREHFASDERVLGGSGFVDQVLREVRTEPCLAAASAVPELGSLRAIVCGACGVMPDALRSPGKMRAVSKAREGVAYLWIEFFGQNGRRLALDLGLRPSSIYKAAKRGRKERERWIALLSDRLEEKAG